MEIKHKEAPMSGCCEEPAAPAELQCPVSGTRGRPVGLTTLDSLLAERAREKVDPEACYFFCPETSCAAVYYSADGDRTFTEADLTVPVWQKAPANPNVPVCYCFQYTPDMIARELAETGRSTTVADISAKMRAGLCDCERNNPQGGCCLGNVNTAVGEAKKKAQGVAANCATQERTACQPSIQ